MLQQISFRRFYKIVLAVRDDFGDELPTAFDLAIDKLLLDAAYPANYRHLVLLAELVAARRLWIICRRLANGVMAGDGAEDLYKVAVDVLRQETYALALFHEPTGAEACETCDGHGCGDCAYSGELVAPSIAESTQ